MLPSTYISREKLKENKQQPNLLHNCLKYYKHKLYISIISWDGPLQNDTSTFWIPQIGYASEILKEPILTLSPLFSQSHVVSEIYITNDSSTHKITCYQAPIFPGKNWKKINSNQICYTTAWNIKNTSYILV